MGEPPPELDPRVRKAFSGRPPGRIEEVADVYGKLLARSDPEWEAAMQPVWEAALFRLLPRPDQNQLRQLRAQSDLLELSEPGAVARYRVSFRSDDRVVPHVDRRDPAAATPGTSAPAVSRTRGEDELSLERQVE